MMQFLDVQPARPTRPFSLLRVLLVLASLGVSGLSASSPSEFYGFWQSQEPAGDEVVINIKRAGRASAFWIGSGSNDLMKGRWELEGERLIISWESGYRDVLTLWDEGTSKREAYGPNGSLSGGPSYETRARRVDPRLPGSLAVDSGPPSDAPTADSSSAPDESASAVEPEAADRSAPEIPMRNPYVGYWMVEQSPGMLFGLMSSASDHFYIFLDRDGRASVALRRWGADNALRGSWELVDGEARITWPSGHKDVLVRTKDGEVRLRSLGRKDDFGDRGGEVRAAQRSNATEAAQYFNSGDVRLLTMTDIRGIWAAADPNADHQDKVHILGWGQAELRSDGGELRQRGSWKLFNDHVVVSWNDGSKDVLRNNLRYWQRERLAPGMSVGGSPVFTQRVIKIAGEKTGTYTDR